MPVQLQQIEFPYTLISVWNAFGELNSTRSNNGFGPSPISYLEISAWSTLTNNHLSSWEIKVLKMLDSAFLQYASSINKESS